LLPKSENIKKLIKNISSNYKKPLEIIQLYHTNDNFKNVVHRIDTENQAMLLLKQTMTIIQETYTLNQFVHHR
jgi:trigger factor